MLVGGREHSIQGIQSSKLLTEVMDFKNDKELKWTTFPAIELGFMSYPSSCNMHFKKNGDR